MSNSNAVLGPITIVGMQSGGTAYEYTPWTEGKVISKITVWDVDQRTKACKLWKTGETDNQGTQYGQPSGSSYSYTFSPGELVTSMSLWAGSWNGNAGDRAGRIEFTTVKANGEVGTFGHGYQSGQEHVIDVYSGILCGADVRAGDDINAWGFAFLKPVISCTLEDVTYTNLSGLGSITPVTLDSLNTKNNSENDLNWKLEGSKTMTVSGSWSVTQGVTASLSVSVKAGIPEIAEVNEEFQWQVSKSYTSQVSYSAQETLTWSESGELSPGQSINIKALTYTGSINVPYSGTMVLVVEGNHSYSFPQSGTYTGVSVTSVQIVVQ